MGGGENATKTGSRKKTNVDDLGEKCDVVVSDLLNVVVADEMHGGDASLLKMLSTNAKPEGASARVRCCAPSSPT